MNAAARVTIQARIDEGTLERVPVDGDVVTNLQRQVANHLRTAHAGLGVEDPDRELAEVVGGHLELAGFG